MMDYINMSEHNSAMIDGSNCCISNSTNTTADPNQWNDLKAEYGPGYMLRASVLVLIFIVSLLGNTFLALTLIKNKRRRSRMHALILHLAAVDLLFTFFVILQDFIWSITFIWAASNIMCKLSMFLKIYCLFISVFILVVITIDRWSAILFPLSSSNANVRCKVMLVVAHLLAIAMASPNLIIYSKQSHPDNPAFIQCVSLGNISNLSQWVFNIGVCLLQYVIPLVIMIYCYSAILHTIVKASKTSKDTSEGHLRRTGTNSFPRAKVKTVKMTACLLATYLLVWTPYQVVQLWMIFESDVGEKHPQLTDALQIFGLSNAATDSIVYGFWNINIKKELAHLCPMVAMKLFGPESLIDGNNRTTMSRMSVSRTCSTPAARNNGYTETQQSSGHHPCSSNRAQNVQFNMKSFN